MKYEAVVIGASTGGMYALREILSQLQKDFPAPIMIVQHMSPNADSYLAQYLNEHSSIQIKEAEEKELVQRGFAYIAPPNYHLLIEKDGSLSLTVDEKVNYARPAIDVLFETAADTYKEKLIGVILTGANSDGSKGLKRIKEKGGLVIVQDPKEAEAEGMPLAAIKTVAVDYILQLNKIGLFLNKMIGEN